MIDLLDTVVDRAAVCGAVGLGPEYYVALAEALYLAVSEPSSAVAAGAQNLSAVNRAFDRIGGWGCPIKKDLLISAFIARVDRTVRPEREAAYKDRLQHLWLHVRGLALYASPGALELSLSDPQYYSRRCRPNSEALIVAVMQRINTVGV